MKLDTPATGAGSLEPLSKRARHLLLERIGPEEQVLLCLVGESGHALVALGDRLLVVKAGLGARLTLSDEVASFDYAEVEGVELVTGEVNSVITVRSRRPAFGKEWWHARDSSEDPVRAMNSIVIRTSRLQEYEPGIERLRRLVAASRRPTSAGPGAESGRDPDEGREGLVSLLERLAALHASGSLSDEEFELAKRRVLE